jgi:hypothetical protein
MSATKDGNAEGGEPTSELGEQPTTELRAGDPSLAPVAASLPAGQPLVGAGTPDLCASCGARLLADQRYCVACGERRGKPRFTLPSAGASQSRSPAARTGEARTPRMSASGGFIGVVATLILAMGVGVLIGQNAAGSNAGKQGVTAYIGGGAGAGAGADTSGGADAAAAGDTTTSTGHRSKSASSKAVPKVNTTTVATPPASVAHGAQINGHGATNLPPPTAQQGQSCTNGEAGCQNGQRTGNFFGN